MELHMVCATWVKDDDKKVLDVLLAAERQPSIEETAEITGLPAHRVERTLGLWKQQEAMYKRRKQHHDFL